jgi:predicted ArsR family transcriptional regulator
MDLCASQLTLLDRLKSRGPQSVKILANQLGMTTMGTRQHLQGLADKGYVETAAIAEKQTRGRPAHYWSLTEQGHAHYPDGHKDIAIQLINLINQDHSKALLDTLVNQRSEQQHTRYSEALSQGPANTAEKLQKLAKLRTDEGYMAEVRLLPDGWLFIENHCPIASAARSCSGFCKSELALFQQLLGSSAHINQVDHLMTGARRCTFKVKQTVA